MDIPTLPAAMEVMLTGMFLLGLVSFVVLLVQAIKGPDRWLAGVNTLAWRPFRLRHIVWMVILLLGMQLAMASLAGAKGIDIKPDSTASLVLSTLLMHWTILLLALYLLQRNGWSLTTAFGGSRHGAWSLIALGMVGYLALLPVIALVSWGTMTFIDAWNRAGLPFISYEEQVILEYMQGRMSFRLAYSVFTAILLAPFGEEVFFRGMMLPALARSMGGVQASVIVSVVFAGIHFHLAGFPVLFVLSLALSAAYIRTRSLLTPIALHATFNLATVLIVNYRGGT